MKTNLFISKEKLCDFNCKMDFVNIFHAEKKSTFKSFVHKCEPGSGSAEGFFTVKFLLYTSANVLLLLL